MISICISLTDIPSSIATYLNWYIRKWKLPDAIPYLRTVHGKALTIKYTFLNAVVKIFEASQLWLARKK